MDWVHLLVGDVLLPLDYPFVMAHLVVGLPAFLGFIPLAWASLIGHCLFGMVVAVAVRWREGRIG